jgi:hypothetical protein
VRAIVTGALVLALAGSLAAQEEPDTAGVRGLNWFAYPYAFYTPETNLAFGAAGIMYFRTERDRLLNPSQVLLSGYYSINDQYDVTLSPQFYFSRNRYYASLETGFKKVIDKFYGIGNNSEDTGKEPYTANAIRAELVFQMPPILLTYVKLVGLIYRYNYYLILDEMENPLLRTDAVAGTEGGASSGFWIRGTISIHHPAVFSTSSGLSLTHGRSAEGTTTMTTASISGDTFPFLMRLPSGHRSTGTSSGVSPRSTSSHASAGASACAATTRVDSGIATTLQDS